MLPQRWRTNHKTQTVFALAVPFSLDYLLVAGVMVDAKVPIIPMLVYVGLHSIFLIDYWWRFPLPDWASSMSATAVTWMAVMGGLLGVLTLDYPSGLVNFLCGSSSLVIVLSSMNFWLGEIGTKAMLQFASSSLAMLSLAAALSHEPGMALAIGIWGLGVFFQSRSIPVAEHRFGDQLE